MTKNALLIGGTGPTGHHIVNGLLHRGYTVSILHRGGHEVDEIPPWVEHIHTDPYDETCLIEALSNRKFELCIANYGRLRAIAKVMQGKCQRFISAGGGPAYRGYMNPGLGEYHGLSVPIYENAALVSSPEEDEKGYRIARTEKAVFELQPEACHFRFPYIYGAYQLVPREWLFVKRFLDGRRQIILPDGGLTLHSFGYAENIAHAILLAVDNPKISKGKIYNVADDEVLSLRQVAHIIAQHMNVELEIINIPWELTTLANPLMMQPLSSHRMQDTSAIRHELGYSDKVKPAEALARTVDWLIANPPQPGGMEEMVLEDPFDYAAEDEMIRAWKQLTAKLPAMTMKQQAGYGMHYSGPGGRARSQSEFSE